jgi:predicted ATPase
MTFPFVSRLVLRNYKSIAACDVTLGPLTFLVGPNGAGKSNLLDGLRLVADGLNTPLDHAIRERGGIDAVRRKSTGHPHNFGIRLELRLSSGRRALYAFEVAAKSDGGFDIKEERCWIEGTLPLLERASPAAGFVVRRGEVVESTLPSPPSAFSDRLYLVNLSGIQEFRELYDALSSMRFYNLTQSAIREWQSPDPGRLLSRDGGNLASVFDRLERDAPESVLSLQEYLSKIVPDVRGVKALPLANKITLQFKQHVKGATAPWKFEASAMSDGTLRALGVLTALAQAKDTSRPVPLVAIEEPEAALHPAAAEVLFEALMEASAHAQVLVTSHSPDLLDHEAVEEGQLLAVTSESGVTLVGPISEVGRSALRDHLYSAGELLRMAQLEPDEATHRLTATQLELFASLSP